IPGDGIGPELAGAAVEVLRAAAKAGQFELALDHHEAGASLYRRTGRVMTDETLAACRAAQGVLKGPVGDLSMVLSAAVVLGWLGETDAGRRVRPAVAAAFGGGGSALHPPGPVGR